MYTMFAVVSNADGANQMIKSNSRACDSQPTAAPVDFGDIIFTTILHSFIFTLKLQLSFIQ